MIELFNIDLLSYTVQTAETAPTHSYTIYWLILLGSMLLSWLVSARMKSRFSEYSQISIPVTGRQVAEQMLKDNHITDVKVISTPAAFFRRMPCPHPGRSHPGYRSLRYSAGHELGRSGTGTASLLAMSPFRSLTPTASHFGRKGDSPRHQTGFQYY